MILMKILRGISSITRLKHVLLLSLFTFTLPSACFGQDRLYLYQSRRVNLADVNDVVAAALVQNNLFNTGKGLLDLSGGFLNIITLLTNAVRQKIVLSNGDNTPEAIDEREQLNNAIKVFE